jgi:hypothetical protein
VDYLRQGKGRYQIVLKFQSHVKNSLLNKKRAIVETIARFKN